MSFGDGDERVVDISLSDKHGIAITDRGRVYTWGRAYCGEIGYKGSMTLEKPMMLELEFSGQNFIQVFCNKYTSVLIGGNFVQKKLK